MGERQKKSEGGYSGVTSRAVPQQELQAHTGFLEKPRPAIRVSIGPWREGGPCRRSSHVKAHGWSRQQAGGARPA